MQSSPMRRRMNITFFLCRRLWNSTDVPGMVTRRNLASFSGEPGPAQARRSGCRRSAVCRLSGAAIADAIGRARRSAEQRGCRAKSIRLRRSKGWMIDLTSLTLAQARDALRRKDFSATELVDACLAGLERARALNAFVLETPERARVMAHAADERLARGVSRSPVGLPLR